jgi:hypothetical protein
MEIIIKKCDEPHHCVKLTALLRTRNKLYAETNPLSKKLYVTRIVMTVVFKIE